MAIAGMVLLTVGVVLWWVQARQQGRCTQLKLARSVEAAELAAMATAVAQEIGGGDWRDYVWLWGTPKAATPLASEFKQVPCVCYTSTVIREYEETVQERDGDGRTTTRTQRGTETISEHKQRISFELVDASGAIWVETDGAKVECVEVLNEFRPGNPAGGLLSFGAFSLALGNPLGGAGRRTLGYRYRETVLPLNRPVLVVGAASDRTGTVAIEKPAQDNQPYIITTQSHAALTQSVSQSAQIAFWSMAGCLGLGAMLLLVEVIT